MTRLTFLCLLGCLAAPAALQDPSTYSFFSGTVVKLENGELTVQRSLQGEEREERKFRVTAETKVEGELKEGGRITVSFLPAEPTVAVRILVRVENKPPA